MERTLDTELRAAIEGAWNTGREQWPGTSVGLELFTERVLLHTDDVKAVDGLHAADLYLACGCQMGCPNALAAFEREIMPTTLGALRRLDASADFADEVHQQLRDKLFVASDPNKRKILEYAARGPLSAWVRVSAVRTGLNLRASQRRKQPVTVERVADFLPTDNPSLEYLKSRYSTEFSEALRAAGARLEGRDRTIMRLKFVDDLNIEEIGSIYDVHRATVARWLTRIRAELFAATRSDLEKRLDISPTEFESLLELVRSRIDFSMSVLLRDEAE